MQRTLRNFAEWKAEVEAWASPGCTIPLLGVHGTQGLTKTYTLESVLGERAKTIRCHGTPIELVRAIYEANALGQIPLLDDIDSLLKDVKALNLLKGGLDTNGRIQWASNTQLLTPEQKDFSVHVRVAVVSNDPLVFTKHLRAVEDRGIVYHLNPDAYEVHDHVGKWWPEIREPLRRTDDEKTGPIELCPAYDDEVYQHLGSILDLIAMPTVRAYANSARMKLAGMDWRASIEDTFCLDQEHQFVRHLMLNPAFTGEERICEFGKKVQKSRSTFFRYQDEITRRLGIKPVPTDDKLRRERIAAGQKQYVPPGFEPPALVPDKSPVVGPGVEFPGQTSSNRKGLKRGGK